MCHAAGFERPYGLAWLLTLVAELKEFVEDVDNPNAELTRQWIEVSERRLLSLDVSGVLSRYS